MKNVVIGREKELKILDGMVKSKKAEFLAIYGRRRVGKTFLIKNWVQKKSTIFFRATGKQGGSLKEQIRHVTDEIGNAFYNGARLESKKNWSETFAMLTEGIAQIKEKNKPITLFFDEFPWMATKKSKLLQALDHSWNHIWSNDSRIKLIICGSSSSWIVKNIVNNKGGLHNRITKNMRLEPFNLRQTKEYLESIGVTLNNNHIMQIYMVTGGIPYYLSHIEPGLSASKIIGGLAFHKDALLLNEFNNLYSSLFENSEKYVDLIKIIGKKRYGISQSELIKKSKYFSKGGRITEKLAELEQAGFIMSFIPYQHNRQGIYYRLIDEYTLFYFSWIEPIKSKLKKEDLNSSYWENIQKLPAWKIWAGLSFEALCFKHITQIRNALEISSDAMVDSWRYAPRDTKESGAQIDLLFDRNDNAITLCEIKYTNSAFQIDKSFLLSLNKKEFVFRECTHTKKQLFWAVISANGIKKYSIEKSSSISVVTSDSFFSE